MDNLIKKVKKKEPYDKLLKEIIDYDIKINGSVLTKYLTDSKFKDYLDDKISIDKCIWFNDNEKLISSILPIHDIIYTNNNDRNFFTDIIHYKSKLIETNKKFIINKPKEKVINKEALYKKLQDTIQKCKNDNKTEASIKSIITKTTKKIENIDKTLKTYTYNIYPNADQIKTIHGWFNECDLVYNKCIELNEQHYKLDLNYMKTKTFIFDILYGDTDKPAPYGVLTDEVRSYCSNLKSCLSNKKNGNIKYFIMKPKKTKSSKSILISRKSIKEEGIYTTLLGKMDGMEHIDVTKITSDCRLVYDRYFNKYYLKCPMYAPKKEVLNRKDIVALDPGEKIFMTYYSLNDSGMIGFDIRKKILMYQTKIKQLQRRLKKKISNKSRLTKKIRKNYRKIKNMVKELHNKTALYLVKNYNKILIPKFETSSMIGKTYIKKRFNEIKTTENINKKIEIRKLTKKVQLTKKTKFVMNNLSHYSFRQHLKHKCSEYGCELKVVTEEYTSKCCSKCGCLSNIYRNREKKCIYCKFKIDRDVNGSRNILIKNWNGNYKIRS